MASSFWYANARNKVTHPGVVVFVQPAGDTLVAQAANLVALERATIAETKADMLSHQVDQLSDQVREAKPPAWQFWRR